MIATWLATFAICPQPTGPMRVTRPPMTCSTGCARSKSSSEPPHMIVSVPLTAPSDPPDTGAST